ncbi:MAG: STN domain-containing protein, partial [Planctomycetaceae bacterium]
EIRDGLSETILATGAGCEWGSWGAGGRPTLREFTAPPVIDGTDGLGTGTPEVLLVLMADGRVQSLAADIDPQVFASLIAVGDREPAPEPARNRAGLPSSAGEPAIGELTADEHEGGWLPIWATPEEGAWLTVNLEDRLATVLLSFDQPPASRASVLRVLEGLVGVPIHWEAVEGDLADETLRGSVSLSRRQVSIGQLLDAVLQETPLTWRARGASIRIQSRPEGEAPQGAQPGSGPPGTEQ